MALALITPPVAKPLTLEEVKRHLKVETPDDDDYIASVLDAAVNHLEMVCGIKLISQTWREYRDCFPVSGLFRLSVGPVRAISELRYYDEHGDPQAVSGEDMELDRHSVPPRLLVKSAPAFGNQLNGIEIDIVAGFGETSVDVPDSLKRALLIFIAHNYEFRGAIAADQQPVCEPHGFRTLIAPFRRVKL